MKPPRFSYARPETLDEVVELLGDAGDEAKLLAGGQSLVPMLNLRLARPSLLIDVALVDGMDTITRENGELAIGAGVRQRGAETSREIQHACPLVVQALRYVGHLQTRARGTIGGSLAHADPAAELAAVAVTLDAELVAVSRAARRIVPAGEFFLGPFTTALEPDEVLVEVRLRVRPSLRTTFREFTRRHGDFALAGIAAAVEIRESSGAIEEARLTVIGTGLGGRPVRLRRTEDALIGALPEASVLREVREVALTEFETVTPRATSDARHARRVASVLVERALKEVGC